ncbi:hypothetical protein ACJ7K1_25925 [Paenibacillus elgii]
MNGAAYVAAVWDLCSMAQQKGFAGINVDYPSCREALVQCAHEHGLLVWVYSLPESGMFPAYAEMKLDAVSTLDVSATATFRERMRAAL